VPSASIGSPQRVTPVPQAQPRAAPAPVQQHRMERPAPVERRAAPVERHAPAERAAPAERPLGGAARVR
jgi:hypothetical protein